MVPLLDLQAQYNTVRAQVEAAILRVAQSQHCILGPEVAAMEEELAHYLGVRYAIGVSSGTDALLMAFMALGIGANHEVIVPDFSFFATAGCVSRLGATPVFVDVEPRGFTISPAAVEQAITPRTKAIVPVHMFGQSANMDALMAIGERYGIPIVEDAAQAIGTQVAGGRRVGTMGLMGCFSFYPTKNLGAFGDAGLITTNNEDLAKHLVQLRNHGMEPRYYHRFIGGNFRIDAMQAAVLRVKLPHLEGWHAARRANVQSYRELFAEAGIVGNWVGAEVESNGVGLPHCLYEGAAENHHIYNQFTIRVANRDNVRSYLQDHGIGTEVYYPVPFHKQECFSNLESASATFPITDALCKTVLSLPVYPELSRSQIQEVVETVAAAMRIAAAL